MDVNITFQDLVKMGVVKRPVGRPAAIKEHTLRIRVTQIQLQKLENYAQERGLSMSDVIRNYLNRLPNSKINE